jgi:hypothetical protein
MSMCRPVSSPMAANLKLVKLTEAEIDPRPYQSALGSLMYAMLGSRPDIAFSVTALSQHSTTPSDDHWDALMRVFRYLHKTKDAQLVFRGSSKHSPCLFGYSDADWAGDINDRRSVGAYVFVLADGAISWSAQKQKVIAQSSTEAEYIAGASATNEAIWLRRLLSEIGYTQSGPTCLLIDNQSAISLAKNAVNHSRTKHIDVKYHHMCFSYESGDILPEYIPTGDEVADALTKPLASPQHHRLVSEMGIDVLSSMSH